MTTTVWLPLVPVVLLVTGALASLSLATRPRLASWVGASAAVLACAIGLPVSLWALGVGASEVSGVLPWHVPLAALVIGVDPLTAFFAVPVYGLGGVAAVYGFTYMRAWEGRKNLGAVWFAFDLLLAAMAMVLLARNGILFLFAWEVMSIAAWSLVSFEHDRPEARWAGWVYLVVSHASIAVLFVLFLVLSRASGGNPDFTVLASPAPVGLLVALALLGFGAKVGLPPLHVWLPEAHAAAPSHVSAVMSGVVVNMGLYGLLRTVQVVGGPPAWLGPLLLLVGLAGAGLGIAMALSQRDLKRALAYSTIENMGIVTLALGVSFMGRAAGDEAVAALGAAGALLHVWNHALMKGLMFLGAGSVLHATGTKDLEALGGLGRLMPRTGGLMTFGAVALAALPPLNGFTSEWLVYLGLVRGGADLAGAAGLGLLLAVGWLALVGALAAAAFARIVGITFLGEPRSARAAHAHEAPMGMLLPMAVLAFGCAVVGLAPQHVVRLFDPAVLSIAGTSGALPASSLVPLSALAVALWVSIGVVGAGLWWVLRRAPVARSGTWDCGYAAPTPRMQYTGRAFARNGADSVMPLTLRPEVATPTLRGPFPDPARLEVTYPDPLLEHGYLALFRRAAERFSALRRLQHGRTHLYVAYIGVAVVLALTWVAAKGGGP